MARASDARRASLEDANLVEAIVGMQQADAAHQAAVGAVSQTTRLSLFDFLR
jgi:flagellin-like hook-associated protein FlgL